LDEILSRVKTGKSVNAKERAGAAKKGKRPAHEK
jgi:hypothetical protein